jgi:hypothetical protein
MKTGWLAFSILWVGFPAVAQTNCEEGSGPLAKDQAIATTPAEIIQRFSANEARFQKALVNYVFTQDVTLQTLNGKRVDGEYRMGMEVSYDSRGKRLERVNFAPRSTLSRLTLTTQDLDDIRSLADFSFTPDNLSKYEVHYVGQQHVDELDTYAFDIKPLELHRKERYFQGRLWVDTRDDVIVKTCGKRVPDLQDKRMENKSPKFVTYRELIDGQYWFPTYVRADDFLSFARSTVRLHEVIKFTNYHAVKAKPVGDSISTKSSSQKP